MAKDYREIEELIFEKAFHEAEVRLAYIHSQIAAAKQEIIKLYRRQQQLEAESAEVEHERSAIASLRAGRGTV